MKDIDKKYYKIKDVAELLDIPASTLRYWEQEFPGISPRRSQGNRRYYTPDDIRQLRIIHFLVKIRGLRIDAAKEELKSNRENIDRRLEIIGTLGKIRNELEEMLSALTKRRQ